MALDFTSPLDISLAPVAFGLDTLANFLVLVLSTPEWGRPWGYSRSDYNPEDFCQYILRWILDGNVKITVCFALFCLVIAATYLIPSPYCLIAHLQSSLDQRNREYRLAEDKIRNLGSQVSSLQEQARNNATASAETITTLQRQNTDLETRLGAEQEVRRVETEDALEAKKEQDAWIERLSKEVMVQRERAETAEQALRKKDNPSSIAEQQQQEGSSKLAAERIEQLEEEAKERKSEQEALQDRTETAESNEHALQSRVKAVESQERALQAKFGKSQTELSEIRRERNKATNDANALRKDLMAANHLIKTQEAKHKTLTDDNSTIKEECTKLEQENKTIKTAKKQQQEADPRLIIELKAKLDRKSNEATERIKTLEKKHNSDQNSLQEQLKTTKSDVQRLHEKNRTAELANAKLTEKCDKATSDVERAEKLLQEHQSKTEKVQETLKDCQQALKAMKEAKGKQVIDHHSVLKAKDKGHKDAVRSKDIHIHRLEDCGREATEKTAEHDRKMAHAQAELKTLRDDLELKSSTIRDLEFELESASIEVEEVKGVISLLEKKKWHESAKQQEAWILESYTIIQDQLERAELYIQALEVALEGLQEEHKVALEAADKASAIQKRQYEEAPREAAEDLKECRDHAADQPPREPTEREDELDHGIVPKKIADFDNNLAAECQVKELDVEAVVDGDDLDDKSSQHQVSEGNPKGEYNDASHFLQIEQDGGGNPESARYDNFDREAVDRERKVRRRAKNQDKNRGGAAARMRRADKQAQVPQEQQTPAAAANNLGPITGGPDLLHPAQDHPAGRGRQQHQASAQHWNDFADAASQEYDDHYHAPQQAAVQMPPSGPRLQVPNGFRGGRGRRGRGRS